MTRPVHDPAEAVRASVRIGTLAERWDCDVSQIRKLIDGGQLEAHGLGVRGVRVFLDSALDYQKRHDIAAKKAGKRVKPRRERAAAVESPAHRAAYATLRKHGL